jgi:hypothetical protein
MGRVTFDIRNSCRLFPRLCPLLFEIQLLDQNHRYDHQRSDNVTLDDMGVPEGVP